MTIGNSVTSIGGYAFRGCSSLTSVTIPNSVTSIGSYAIDGCRGLPEIYYNAKAVEEVFGSFSSAGTSSGGFRAVIGDSVELIPAYLFADCRGLKSVTIGNSVTSIGGYAFYNCGALKSVTIPDSVTGIGDFAFEGCTGLTSVTIPNGVTSIGRYAFSGCTGLTKVYYNAKSIEEENSFSYFEGAGTSSDGLRAVIGDSVERIPANLFGGCTGLTSVTIPDRVTRIGGGALCI